MRENMKWKIGDVEIDNQIVMAPMARYGDSTFRQIVKSMGCGLIETEMVHDKSLCYGSSRSKYMLYMTDYERPLSQQILVSDVESVKTASKIICDEVKPDIIDLNMGCSVAKVAIRSQNGSALLKDPQKVRDLVEATVESVSIPVTVKIRSGWNSKSINAVEISRIIEDAGASAITLHPRTGCDSYGVPADWSLIKDVKDAVSIPVIGNGDVKSCYDAKAMLDETGCDAVMIGRGILGNPWLVKQCIDYLDYGIEPEEVTVEEKIAMMKKHTEMLIELKGEKWGIKRMRSPNSFYLNGMPQAIDVKRRLFKIDNKEELFELFDEYLESVAKDSK